MNSYGYELYTYVRPDGCRVSNTGRVISPPDWTWQFFAPRPRPRAAAARFLGCRVGRA